MSARRAIEPAAVERNPFCDPDPRATAEPSRPALHDVAGGNHAERTAHRAADPNQFQRRQIVAVCKRLADIRARMAEPEHRLAELENCAQDRGMSAMLIDNVTATLELLREHEARLESRLVAVKAGASRR